MFRSGAAAWRQSIRPLAQANIGPYLFYGLALALAQDAQFSARRLILLLLWGFVAHAVIIWTNDVADADIDAKNESPTLFSGGSRVLPEGQLSPTSIARAARWASALLVGGSACISFGDQNPLALGCGLATLVLSHAYSSPPVQLSRRGHGEWLQALGIGVVLPSAGFAIAGGPWADLPVVAMLPTLALGLGGNILTALPDYKADLDCGKRSPVVRLGLRTAKGWATATVAAAGLAAAGTLPGLSGQQKISVAVVAFAATLTLIVYSQIRGLWSDRSTSSLEFCFAASVCGQTQLGFWLYLLLSS